MTVVNDLFTVSLIITLWGGWSYYIHFINENIGPGGAKQLPTDPQLVDGSCALLSFSHVRLFVTPWTTAHRGPLSMGFSWEEHWSGLPCPPPGDLFDPGIEPASLTPPALAGGFFTTSATWEARSVAEWVFKPKLWSPSPNQWFSKCGDWVCSISINFSLIRNADSWVPDLLEQKLWACGPSIYSFTSPLGDSDVHLTSSLHHMDLQLLCGIWDLSSQPGIEPASPVFQGGFLTTGPPGKSLSHFLKITILLWWYILDTWVDKYHPDNSQVTHIPPKLSTLNMPALLGAPLFPWEESPTRLWLLLGVYLVPQLTSGFTGGSVAAWDVRAGP